VTWIEALIAWTDSSGQHWGRVGRNLPKQVAEPATMDNWTWD
jgi:hypothetical protein